MEELKRQKLLREEKKREEEERIRDGGGLIQPVKTTPIKHDNFLNKLLNTDPDALTRMVNNPNAGEGGQSQIQDKNPLQLC